MTTPAPLASVVVPAYDCRPYILEAVRSVLDQEVRDIEVLVVDDASRDGTADVVRDLDPRVRLFVLEQNGGAARARNRAFQEARGPVIFFQDADDVSEPDRISRCLEVLDRHPEVGLVYGQARCIDAGGEADRERGDGGLLDPQEFDLAVLLERNFIYTGSVAVRTEVLRAAGPMDPDLPLMEDWDLWMRICTRSPARRIPAVLYRYRDRPGRLSHQEERAMAPAVRARILDTSLRLALMAPGIPLLRRLGLLARLLRKRLGLWRRRLLDGGGSRR